MLAHLQGHPIAGASWEGFVVEQIAALAPQGSQIGFYRTASGAEIDVVTTGSRRMGFEIKLSAAPKPVRGFWQARQDLKLGSTYVVAPVRTRYPLAEGGKVLPVQALREVIAVATTPQKR